MNTFPKELLYEIPSGFSDLKIDKNDLEKLPELAKGTSENIHI